MKKRLRVFVWMFIAAIILLNFIFVLKNHAYKEPEDSEAPSSIPSGMEIRKEGGHILRLPKGAKVRREGTQLFVEGMDSYAGRKFEEADNRFAVIDEKLKKLDIAVAKLKEAVARDRAEARAKQ